MTISVDPENNEPRALFAVPDFNGRRVLEIGCGGGRLTWRYADKAAPSWRLILSRTALPGWDQ